MLVLSFPSHLGKIASEMYEILKTTFSDNDVGRTQTPEWFSPFRQGETLVEDCGCSGCPSRGHIEENVEKDRNIINTE
jgi:hypothetical protein